MHKTLRKRKTYTAADFKWKDEQHQDGILTFKYQDGALRLQEGTIFYTSNLQVTWVEVFMGNTYIQLHVGMEDALTFVNSIVMHD